MNLLMKKIISIMALLLSGCAVTVVEMLGIGATTEVASGGAVSTTALEIAQTVDTAKTVGDGVSYVETGKTLTDHAMDELTGKDCKASNLLDKKDICQVKEIDLNEPVIEKEQ